MRAAIALAGVDASAVPRGATLVTLPDWPATLVVRADATLLPGAPTLRPRTKVRFHLATSDVGARVVAVGSPVGAGESRPVRIVLDEPVMARAGDRFVLRSASPLATIGGGVITDPLAGRRAPCRRTSGWCSSLRSRASTA
jgi:selenocysteine-specific elongation factor